MEMKKHNDMQKYVMESYHDMHKHATCKHMQHAKTCQIKKHARFTKKRYKYISNIIDFSMVVNRFF